MTHIKTAKQYTNLLTPCNILPSFRYVYPYLRNKKVLDIGCATGEYLQLFNPKSEGLDYSKKNIAICKKKKLKIKRFDFNKKLPYKANTFEGVFCSHVLEHVDSPIKLIQECNRILIKNGVLVIGLPSEKTIVRNLYDHYFKDHPTHIYSFSQDCIENLLIKNGFLIIDKKLDFCLLHKIKLNLIIDKLQKFNKILFGVSNAYWIVTQKNEDL